MHKRYIAGILLAALLVSLCGCTSVFDKEYLSVRPYEEPSNLLTDADTTQIRNYATTTASLPTIWPPPARSCAPAPPSARTASRASAMRPSR